MARKQPLLGNPVPLRAARAPTPATRIVWATQSGAKVITELTPAEAASIFVYWGVNPDITEDLCGRALTSEQLAAIREADARPQPYPYVGHVEARSISTSISAREPSLTELLRRLERQKLVEPSRPWWARVFEGLVQRFGEDLIILAATGVIGAFFFGKTVFDLYHAAGS
ncbi:hypothetical protein [Caulobacter sp. Root343]|uniref:hypothetical protein n=1 Tax=Caulobacter sp. Root343 TaxID=1736520 RepID=UPI0006F8176D|nr:hypothetical protein [Caulobacter sp. Root343]KQV66606.1 hypothetical protein ASC70_12290 [Caulobacter sp. Root343]